MNQENRITFCSFQNNRWHVIVQVFEQKVTLYFAYVNALHRLQL